MEELAIKLQFFEGHWIKHVHLWPEGSMIGIHCYLAFVGDILGFLKIFFCKFLQLTFLCKN